ncbi:c-type cytochrome domain-containing protein [Luteolibacter algae]|uniref:C-type cytochrome domain-containing protein n=1 Tax=Luteolibacter algae TaxID=454151 RepID=A0ABW5D5F4_9BACT
MSTETDLDAAGSKHRKPWGITLIGLITIGGLIAMPYLAGEPDGEKMPDIVRFLGHFHPVLLHLPIGIFSLILFQELLAMVSRKKPQRTIFPMFFGAASAVLAVLAGFLLYHGGGFEGSELAHDHLWGGLIFACAAVFTFIVKSWSMAPSSSQAFYRVLLFSSVGIMGYASHDGASITHGSDYLTQYAPNPIREALGLEPKIEKEEKAAKPLEEQIVYADIIQPILEMRCVECHKEGKAKGKFRLDTYDLLLAGGKEGEGIEPGNAIDSNIIFRIDLPEDDDEHMPPEGKKDIEDHEVAILKWWINQGADPAKTVGDLEITDEIRDAIGNLKMTEKFVEDHAHGEGSSDAEAANADSSQPSDDLKKSVDALAVKFPGAITFESQESAGLTFTGVSMRKTLNDDIFAEVGPVIAQLVSLDLSATGVTDRTVALLEPAENLRMIRLSETQITDAAMDTLAKLQNLESINLYGTKVTDAGVKKLSELPNLKRLYLWQTDVSDAAMEELKKANPDLEIVTGI